MYRNWWMRHELDVQKKQGSPIPISGFTRGRKKQRADAVLITFHAPWRTRSAPCMCWTPLQYFCWQQFFQRTLDGPFVKRHDLVLFGQHHNASRVYIYIHDTCFIITIQTLHYWYFSTFENKTCKTYVLANTVVYIYIYMFSMSMQYVCLLCEHTTVNRCSLWWLQTDFNFSFHDYVVVAVEPFVGLRCFP